MQVNIPYVGPMGQVTCPQTYILLLCMFTHGMFDVVAPFLQQDHDHQQFHGDSCSHCHQQHQYFILVIIILVVDAVVIVSMLVVAIVLLVVMIVVSCFCRACHSDHIQTVDISMHAYMCNAKETKYTHTIPKHFSLYPKWTYKSSIKKKLHNITQRSVQKVYGSCFFSSSSPTVSSAQFGMIYIFSEAFNGFLINESFTLVGPDPRSA